MKYTWVLVRTNTRQMPFQMATNPPELVTSPGGTTHNVAASFYTPRPRLLTPATTTRTPLT